MELRIEELTCRRAGRSVFAGLAARVSAGQALLLEGPNGSGKSSLLRILAGLIAPEAGDAWIGEVSLTGDRAEFQSQIVYAGHLDALKPAFTAYETLDFWARLYGADPSGVERALAALALGPLRDHPVRILSAGQRRRLGLARLVLIERPVWLLDEPTTSLDAASTARVADLARIHCKAGGIVVAATHTDFAIDAAQTLNPADFHLSAEDGARHETAVLTGDAW